ncbi:hypothetical protein TruAng_006898 [Truncatella angustata]|nr:hypothetical protein TruAng_006898 [Truncatella angustata]
MLFTLMFRHATNLSKPQEQANIMRICLFIPIYAVGSFIEVCVPVSYVYLHSWLGVAQAFALANFFILLCRFVSLETNTRRSVFLAPMKRLQEKTGSTTAKAVSAYRKTWILVFQYPLIAILIAIFADISEGADRYCYGSHKAYFASLWLEIIEKASMILAVIAVLRTYAKLKVELRPHRALQKLLAFKLLIGLQFIQQIIYMVLTRASPSPLEPSDTLSYTDLEIGIPTLLVSCELVVFSVFFHFAYSVTPYQLSSYSHKPLSDFTNSEQQSGGDECYHGGPFGTRAWISMLNPAELIAAVLFGFKMQKEVDISRRGIYQAMPLNTHSTS